MTTEYINKLKNYPVKNGEVIEAEWTERKEPSPNPMGIRWEGVTEFYKVTMKLHPTPKSNITVMVFLPRAEDWNGKFLGTGNGGAAGSIGESAIMNGVCRGYAAANTDMGTSQDPDDCNGNFEIVKDFGYRSTHLMTTVGKDLATWFYGKAPVHSYYLGGSTGGQQGFSEVQRYPDDYDGVICLSPAYDRVRLHCWFVWNWQQIHKRANAIFTPETARKWKDCLVKEYGKMSGSTETDEFLTYPGRIKENPMDNPGLQSEAEKFLTSDQRDALRNLYDGLKDPVTDKTICAPFLPGTETEMLSLVDISNKDEFAHGYFFPFRWAWGKDFDFTEFDFDKDMSKAIEELSPVLDATSTDLHEFVERGGKLLVIGGSMDAIIPYKGFLKYYEKVIKEMGGLDKVKEFFRFFLMPGFAHTIGGSGVQDIGMTGATIVPMDKEHDVICAMENWVENGVAPERLLGTHFKLEADGLKFGHDRPAYAYPYIAEFMGGDPNDSANYKPVKDIGSY